MKASLIMLFCCLAGFYSVFAHQPTSASVWFAAGYVIWALRKDDE